MDKMGNRKRTLRELSKHPESITEEEKKDMDELFRTIAEIGKISASYGFTVINKNTQVKLSKRIYQEHFVMSAILEAFSSTNEISFKELNESICNYCPLEFSYHLPVDEINKIISKMIRLGFMKPIETDNKYAPNFEITTKGIEAYQAHTFQTLSASSFFSYQTYKLNKRANWMTILMLVVTIVSVITTICVSTT